MNRRRFLGAIPAAVAALTGVKASQAVSPVVGQSEATMSTFDVWQARQGSNHALPQLPDWSEWADWGDWSYRIRILPSEDA